MKALLIIDMINDFVYGKFASPSAFSLIPNIKKLIRKAREKGVPIFFLTDSHFPDDPEISLWGPHAMRGEEGSQVIKDLEVDGAYVVEKTAYDAFFNTPLDVLLKAKKVDTVVLAGIATDICVMHTAAGAFFRGYKVEVVEDCVSTPWQENHKWALEYMKRVYGAKIIRAEEAFE